MRAIELTAYGPPEVLQLAERPDPEPGPRDLRVRVKAASVNPIDTKIRAGAQRAIIRYKLPWILGLDVSGVVEAVGAEVSRFKVGDEVCASLDYKRPGAYAELVLVDEGLAAAKPASLSFEEGAALPLAALTAWQSLIVAGRMKAGDKVFIQAGAGGVGHLAIQLAKARGAWVATTCSERNIEYVAELGADEVINYREQRYEDVLSEMDIVLEAIGGEHRKRSLGVLKKGGRHISIVSDLPKNVKEKGPVLGTLSSFLGVGGFLLCARARGYKPGMVVQSPDAAQLGEVLALAEAGAMTVTIADRFSLEETAAAHASSETGRTRGKIVILPGERG